MATKKKAAPKKRAVSKIPAKKVVTKNATKFKRKNSDHTAGRKGPKTLAIWVDASYLIDLITRGPAPRNVIKILDKVVSRFDQKALKSFLRLALEKMDEKTRKGILKKYWHETRIAMSPEDKKALTIGRAAMRQMKK